LSVRPFGLIRVGLLALVVSSAAFGVRIHAAQAALSTRLTHLLPSAESALEPWLGKAAEAPTAYLMLNGVRLSLRVRQENRSAAELQGTFRDTCPSGTLFTGSIFDTMGGAHSKASASAASPAPTSVSSFTGACLKSAEGRPISAMDWLRRPLQQNELQGLTASVLFSEEVQSPERSSAELSAALEKPSTTSRVLEFDIALESVLRAFPEQGDAPGFDPSFAPRPPGRRVLSVHLETPSAPAGAELAFAYEAKEAPETVLAKYVRALEHRGIKQVRQTGGRAGSMFRNGEQLFAITVSPNLDATLLTLVKLP